MSNYEPYTVTPATMPQPAFLQPIMYGSYILLQPQIISIPAVYAKNIGNSVIMPGTGNLYIYIVYLPDNVSAFVSINGISVPLSAGLNKIPIPYGVTVGPIVLINNNTAETFVALWAFLAS